MVDNEELKKRNLSIIESCKNHMDHPKRFRDLYFVPDYEKAMILLALEITEEAYNGDSGSIMAINKRMFKKIKLVEKLKQPLQKVKELKMIDYNKFDDEDLPSKFTKEQLESGNF